MAGANMGNADQNSGEIKAEVSYLGMAAWVHRVTAPAVRSAIRALQLPPGSRGLDAGCGIGTHTLWLAEAVSPGGHVTGIDTSAECLARAEETARSSELAEEVSFQYGDMSDLPFDDDAVVKPGGIVALLFWSSQRLLPGYPLLEARLNATCAANFPYTDDVKPELHILRTLGWLQGAGLEQPQVRTFVADVQAPLDDVARNALTATFQMFWGKAEPEVTPEDWAEFQRLCQPASPDFILNLPDYYAFITYSLFYGRVSK